MLRRGYLLLCLLMASLIATATVHAQESSGAAQLECSGFVHTDGDADQSQGDADKAVPHHHTNCQSTPAFLPGFSDATPLPSTKRAAPSASVATLTHRWSNGPGLRPPIA